MKTKLTKRKYFTGTKKLKNVKMFEEFSDEKDDFVESLTENELKFDVGFEGDFEGEDTLNQEKEKINKWSYSPVKPITVISVSGTIDTEDSAVDITLSNGDKLEFTCHYSVSPNPKDRDKNFANLKIVGENNNFKGVNKVTDIYMQNLEDFGSVLLAILNCYEEIEEGLATNANKKVGSANEGIDPKI